MLANVHAAPFPQLTGGASPSIARKPHSEKRRTTRDDHAERPAATGPDGPGPTGHGSHACARCSDEDRRARLVHAWPLLLQHRRLAAGHGGAAVPATRLATVGNGPRD